MAVTPVLALDIEGMNAGAMMVRRFSGFYLFYPAITED
jgi:hypothetical protein